MTLTSYILAGGKGERLRPLTETLAKPAVPIADRRIIDIALSHALHASSREVFVLTQYLPHTISDYIKETYPSQTKSPIEVLAPLSNPYLGTADSIRKNLDTLYDTKASYILILSGDQLFQMDFSKMVEQIQQMKVDLIVGCHPIYPHDASRMGVLQLNPEQEVIAFQEKPSDPKDIEQLKSYNLPKSHLASMGIYLFKKDALIRLLTEHTGNDFGKELIPAQLSLGKVGGYVHYGYWEDIGTIRSYFDACLDLASRSPSSLVIDHFIGKNSLFCQGSSIGKNSLIDSSMVGPYVQIGQESQIERSIFIGNPSGSLVGDQVKICNAIIDRGSSIGDGVILSNRLQKRNYEDAYISLVDGIIVVKRNTSIPAGYSF